ncbi:MAG: hypothetical protein MI756_18605 [Chromatiales bacterium]|nr:hypothetical protein [Chromatiales bacterium]
MKKWNLIILCVLVVACGPKEHMLRSDVVAEPKEVGRLYITAQSKVGTDPYKLGVGSKIVSIIHDGRVFNPKGQIIQLVEGIYDLKAEWWRITEDSSLFVPVPGHVVAIPDGSMLKTNGTYDISIEVKAGKTYVIDIASTVHYYNTIPEELCLTEEDHDAKGVTYPAIGKFFRYPSQSAAIAGCAGITLKQGESNKSIKRDY